MIGMLRDFSMVLVIIAVETADLPGVDGVDLVCRVMPSWIEEYVPGPEVSAPTGGGVAPEWPAVEPRSENGVASPALGEETPTAEPPAREASLPAGIPLGVPEVPASRAPTLVMDEIVVC